MHVYNARSEREHQPNTPHMHICVAQNRSDDSASFTQKRNVKFRICVVFACAYIMFSTMCMNRNNFHVGFSLVHVARLFEIIFHVSVLCERS